MDLLTARPDRHLTVFTNYDEQNIISWYRQYLLLVEKERDSRGFLLFFVHK